MYRLLACAVALLVCTSTFAQSKKLGYPHAQLLKDATYYLDNSSGLIDAMDAALAKMKVGDASVPIEKVQTVINTRDKVAQYMKNADDRFKQLPADHPDVKEQLDRVAPLTKRLAEAEAKAKEIHKGLAAVVGQGGGQEYKADFARLREISQMFSNPQIINTQPDKAIDIIKQIPAVKKERARIAEKYAALMQQNTTEARDMKGTLSYSDGKIGEFDKFCQQFAADAPGEIRGSIKKTLDMGAGAVAEKKHAFFGEQGGVPQQLNRVATHLDIFTAISPDSPDAAACKQELADARTKVKEMQASLRDSIIANNPMPKESYRGEDSKALIDTIKAKWTESAVAGDVLKMGINSNEWRRDTRWEWDANAWRKYDKSKLQGFVIVKLNDTQGVVHYLNFVKDHLSNDAVAAYWFDDPKSDPEVTHLMLLSNVK